MVITTGFFDGVHIGHRQILSQLVTEACSRGDESLVVTFWPHPRAVLQQDARILRLLSPLEEKIDKIKSLGVNHVEVVPFTKEFSRVSTEEYLKDILIGRFGAKALLLGYDNRFGSRDSQPADIVAMAKALGLEVIRPAAVNVEDVPVSSTKIREALLRGDLAVANRMLGYSYKLHGVVIAGNRLGTALGFPTANIRLYEPLKLIPASGVYASKVRVQGKFYSGMTNIGFRPTVSSGNALTIETNVFDFSEQIYGLDLEVYLEHRVRDEIKFPSLEALKAQLAEDRGLCEKLLLAY